MHVRDRLRILVRDKTDLYFSFDSVRSINSRNSALLETHIELVFILKVRFFVDDQNLTPLEKGE